MKVLSSVQLLLVCSAVLALSTFTNAGVIANIPVAAAADISGAHKPQYTVIPSTDIITSSHQNIIHSYDGLISHHSKGVETLYAGLHKPDKYTENNKYNNNALYGPIYAKTSSHNSPPTPKTVSVIYTKNAPVPTAASSIIYNQTPYDPVPATAPDSTIYPSPTISLQRNNALYPTAPAPTIRAYQETAYPKYHTNKGHEIIQIVTSSASTGTDAVAPPAPAATVAFLYKSHPTSVAFPTHPAQQIYNHEVPEQPKTIKTINYGHADNGSHRTHGHHYSPAEMVSHVNFEGFGTRWAF